MESSNNKSENVCYENLLKTRHSCRAFLPTPISKSNIEHLLSLAQSTPSWCNTQPWHVFVTNTCQATERFRQALAHHLISAEPSWDIPPPDRYHGVYLDRRRKAGWQLYDAVGVKRGDREGSARQAEHNFRFFGAPHVAIITCDRNHESYGIADCGAYVTNFMLSAHSLGIATIAQASLATYSAFVRNYFDIPESTVIFCGISFGYEDKYNPANMFRTERASLIEAITFKDT